MDKISIIVAFRNRDVTRVSRFLESLSKQTSTNFELIFVDSGSDFTLAEEIKKLVESFSFTKYIYNDSRGRDWNKCIALNIGSKQSTGNFLYFTDIDLIFHEGYIEHLYSLKDAKCQIYTRVFMVNEKFVDYESIFNTDVNSFSEISHTSGKGILLVSKDVFNELGGYDEYYSDWGVEDNDIYIRLCAYGLIEKWADFEKYPVFHQWHVTNDRFHIYPEKWLDDISFHYITKQKKYKRNVNPGKWTETISRKVINVFNDNTIQTIEIPAFGITTTKTLFYRQIWDALFLKDSTCFRIIVPKYVVPKMSFFQISIYKFLVKLLKTINSPFSLEYFQKKERHKYFLPEEDIKWYIRKLVKDTDLIEDYYIMEESDRTIYYIESNQKN